jgi:hypothetical protein
MRNVINTIVADRITRVATIVSWGVVILAVGYIAVIFPNLPPYLPLFNQMGWGDPRLAARVFIILPPLLTLGIIFFNTLIGAMLYAAMPLISRMLSITGLLVSALMLIFIIRVTQLVI